MMDLWSNAFLLLPLALVAWIAVVAVIFLKRSIRLRRKRRTRPDAAGMHPDSAEPRRH